MTLRRFLEWIAENIEELIHQGHSYRDVMNYDLVQVLTFIKLTRKRQKIERHNAILSQRNAYHADDKQIKEILGES